MKKLYLEGENAIELEDGKVAEVFYYLLEEKGSSKKDCIFYGIQIEKREGDTIEIEKAGGISFSKEIVRQMIHKMVEHKITPMTLLEIVDNLVTLELCS